MNILLVAVCWNEEKILPFFLKHYAPFCKKMVICDNSSTDRSQDIIKEFPNTELFVYDTNNQFDEKKQSELKSELWKTYYERDGKIYDWVIALDTDEFIYHPELINLLTFYKEKGVTIPEVLGFQMVADSFPESYDIPLTDQVQWGHFEGIFCKSVVFDPEVNINFWQGSHNCSPTGRVVRSPKDNFGLDKIKLLHYRYFGLDHFIERERGYSTRKPENMPVFQRYMDDPEYVKRIYHGVDRARGPGKNGLEKVL